MIDKLSKNEMNILALLFKNEPLTATEVQKQLKPKIRGSVPAYPWVTRNMKNLSKLGLVVKREGSRAKPFYLTENGKYYAGLLDKLKHGFPEEHRNVVVVKGEYKFDKDYE